MSQKVRIPAISNTMDSARSYKWDLEITGFPGLDGNLLNLRCTTASVPQPNYGPIAIELRGFTKNEAGAVTWNPLSFEAIEVDDYRLLDGFYEVGWLQFHGTTGVQQPKASYQGEIKMIPQGIDDTPRRIWLCHACIINSFTYPDYNSEKATTVNAAFEVSYDWAELV